MMAGLLSGRLWPEFVRIGRGRPISRICPEQGFHYFLPKICPWVHPFGLRLSRFPVFAIAARRRVKKRFSETKER